MEECSSSEQVILSLDIGTTTVRAQLINKLGRVLLSSSSQVKLLYPELGFVEIEPEQLWTSIVLVITKCLQANFNVLCLAISCQRCSFTTWNRTTGKTYHNFITWKDTRAQDIVHKMNDSLVLRTLRTASKCLYVVTRSNRFLAGSVLRLMNAQVTPRLLWVLNNIPNVKCDLEKGDVAFGTIDTWLLNKLTQGHLHVSDVSSASATGMFDPFTMCWASWAVKLVGIPESILPKVVDTAGPHFGNVSNQIFGAEIPIRCCVADQSASTFGSCCFNVGDLKITLGTGAFLNVNTGNTPHASVSGLYPTVGWTANGSTVYLAEGASNDTGSIINWAQEFGLIENVQDSAAEAQLVLSTDGVYFIPAFCGIQAPVNDPQAAAGFIGLKPTTRKGNLLRAVLEAITFRVTQIYRVFCAESNYEVSMIRADGGVSNNDFILQLLADMTQVPVQRADNTETSALGAAFLAGISAGFWKDVEELKKLRSVVRTFHPKDNKKANDNFATWCRAVERFRSWYGDN